MLSLRPADRYALASRAHLQARLNRLEEAIQGQRQLTRIAGTAPQEAAAWFNLGYVLQQAQRDEEAGLAFQKALALQPRLDQAWYGLAMTHIQRRQFHEAAQALQKNIALQPMSPYGWYRLAQVRMALGQPEKAREVIEHLRQFEPRVAAQLERETRPGAAAAPQSTGPVRNAAH